MRLTRFSFLTLLVAAGFALMARPGAVPARQKDKDDLPRKPSAVFAEVNNLKTAGGLGDAAKAKAAFQAFAAYHAEIIAHPKVHSAPLEFKADSPFVAKPPTVEEIITDLNQRILVPEPGSKVGTRDADYIRELGAALDAALAKVVRENPEPVVRVNAMRVLAAACRSGAHAHYPTVTALIANANTPPEVRYYAFQAAANLLAAYDLNYYEYRTHSHKPEVVAELIKALEAAITNPATIVPVPPAEKDKPAAIPADQLAVVQFVRRQAVKALGQVRFAEFEVAKGGPVLYPGFTLARVAVSDPGLTPVPTHPLEVAEAVIGLCNMAPPRQPKAVDKYAPAMADAVATGLITFATPRAATPGDKTIPWKGTAARLTDALKGWRPLFDPGYNPLKPTAFLADLVPKPVATLVGEADKVLTPIEKAEAGTRINVDALKTYRQDLRKEKGWTLAPFMSNDKLVLPQKD